jgi:hypothetical protein
MPSVEGIQTPVPASAFARLATAARYAITGVAPTTWFGPQQPLTPMAPPEVKGRQFDYPPDMSTRREALALRRSAALARRLSLRRAHGSERHIMSAPT